jgi:REP element-mobilizing transposase RayT
MVRRRSSSNQMPLPFRQHGGRREGAGRKPAKGRSSVRHRPRPRLGRNTPLIVTLRARRDVPRLRAEVCFLAIWSALCRGKERDGFRLVQYSVMPDHLHMIVEADDKNALSRGMQGLTIRVARRLNGALGRHGRVFADRFHAESLDTPRRARNALAYVLLNGRRHIAKMGLVPRDGWDVRTSAPFFDGWTERCDIEVDATTPVVPARSWMLNVGWRRWGLVDPREIPGRTRAHAGSGSRPRRAP